MPFTKNQETAFATRYNSCLSCKDTTQLVSMIYSLIEQLHAADEAYIVRLPPHHMGIHPKNRSGKKMIDKTMQKKGRTIHAVGFTFKLCGPSKAVAFEEHPQSRYCETHTLQTTGSELFANYKSGNIRGGSVGCGHLNQWLAAVRDGAESPYEQLCESKSTRISKQRVTANNPDLADAVENGLTWTMIKWTIEMKYPELPTLIQRGLNVEHHIGEGESWDEQLLFTAKKAQELTIGHGSNKQPDWDRVQKAVAASEPPRLIDVPCHIKFLKKWGGGKGQRFTMDTVEYLENKMVEDRIVSGTFLEKLANTKLATFL